jgi:hypothetical protein
MSFDSMSSSEEFSTPQSSPHRHVASVREFVERMLLEMVDKGW